MNQQTEIERVTLGGAEVLFRRLDGPVASWSDPGVRWAVEYWQVDMAYPVAQAWVLMGYGQYIDRLHVMEDYRRRGIGTALLTAIQQRWPKVEFDAFNKAGELFLASNEAWKGGVDYSEDPQPDDGPARPTPRGPTHGRHRTPSLPSGADRASARNPPSADPP